MDDGQAALLGRLALHYQLITQQQLTHAVSQAGGNQGADLTAALLRLGYLSNAQVEQLSRAATEYMNRLRAANGARTTAATNAVAPGNGNAQAARPIPPAPGPRPGAATQRRAGASTQRGANGQDAGRIEWLHRILTRATAARASDVHIHAESPVRLRLRGTLVALSPEPLRGPDATAVLMACCNEQQRATLEEEGEVDFAYELPSVSRFRVNVYKEQHGVCGVFHRILPEPPALAELGLPASVGKLTHYRNGLVLIAGPAGSGKTSTMAALVELINQTRSDHVLTLEDPIEYRFNSNRSIINQREIGTHTHSFSAALQSALREDPDVICVGELRELETIEMALSAAETGHLVIATIHTLGSVRTLNKVIGAYPMNQQTRVRAMLAESLRGVLSQKLVPRADQTDMILAYELLLINQAAANLIREGRTFQLGSILQTGRMQGMRSLDDSLMELLKAGHITKDTARTQAENPSLFR